MVFTRSKNQVKPPHSTQVPRTTSQSPSRALTSLRPIAETHCVKMALIMGKGKFIDVDGYVFDDILADDCAKRRMITFVQPARKDRPHPIRVVLRRIRPRDERSCTLVTIDTKGKEYEDTYHFRSNITLPEWYNRLLTATVSV